MKALYHNFIPIDKLIVSCYKAFHIKNPFIEKVYCSDEQKRKKAS